MKITIFNLLNAINCSGIEMHSWGVAADVNTRQYLGSTESIDLIGKYLYSYVEFPREIAPEYKVSNGADTIYIYALD